jgi:hypothetical protein
MEDLGRLSSRASRAERAQVGVLYMHDGRQLGLEDLLPAVRGGTSVGKAT